MTLASSRLVTLASLVLGLGAGLAACSKDNPNFCESNCDAIDAAIDAAPITCTANGPDPTCPAGNPVCVSGACTGLCDADADCAGRPASESVCLPTTGACVTCDEIDTQAATPGEDECPAANQAVCDGGTHTCRACEAHSECTSGVCDAGRCAPAAEVIYMSANGTDGGNNCDNPASGMGCLTLHFAKGKVTASRKYILMEPSATIYNARNNADRADFDNVTAHIIGYGAKVNRNGGVGEVIELRGGSNVTIEGLEISNAPGVGAGSGIKVGGSRLTLLRATVRDNAHRGIDASSSSSVRVIRSVIFNNDGGGIKVDQGEFILINNLVTANGDPITSDMGGINVSSPGTNNVMLFNTVAGNSAGGTTPDGISCSNATLVATNNIVTGSAGKQRVQGTCSYTYTLFAPDNGPAGAGNMTVAEAAMFMFTSDFHIGVGSVAAGKALSSGLTGDTLVDIDGDPRVPNGTTVDVGADEIP